MQLELQNIGMIKEAKVTIDGLTVIAGENDTGKSTLSKALFYGLTIIREVQSNASDGKLTTVDYPTVLACTDIFKVDILQGINVEYLKNSIIELTINGQTINPKLLSGASATQINDKVKNMTIPEAIFIETPLVWNFSDFFRDIAQIESQMRIKLNYPFLMKDLNFKLHIKSASDGVDIKKQMTELMGGEFKKDEMGRYYFDKQGQKIDLVNTATGIKTFGIFQVLSQNNWLNQDTVLILDEPEVHIHPKWQLEMAKVIVDLVKNGVKIVVNSHSPYMIEALKRYSDRANLQDKTNFYLAQDGFIKKINDSNSQTLVSIYEKLSEPYDIFEEMDSQRLEKFING
ncbi:MAG: hypothetical protein KU38_03050 [Sulfurovum sp. FS08-3]|nr:MAG: hypothetical protein KU38_03050 [Sulfurovum sp. FS08-3]